MLLENNMQREEEEGQVPGDEEPTWVEDEVEEPENAGEVLVMARRRADKEGVVLLRGLTAGVLITWSRVRLCLVRSVLFFTPLTSSRKGKLKKEKKGGEEDALVLDASFEIAEVSLVTVTGKQHAFSIESKERGLHFCAPSAEERTNWIDALTDAVALGNGRDGLVVITRITNDGEKTADDQDSECTERRSTDGQNEEEEQDRVPEGTDEKGISICSYNVNFGMCQLDALGEEERSISAAMRATKADVILLQETTAQWETYLMSSVLAYTYPHVLFRHFDTGDTNLPPAGGIAILSKYPFTELKLIDSPVGWFPAHLLLLHSPIGDVQLLNLHLRPPITREVKVGSFQSALPMIPALSRKARAKECKSYAQHIDWTRPLIVCGDFNEDEKAPSCMFWTKKMNLKSALGEHLPGAMTWWWRLPGGMIINAHYDHIFYQKLLCEDAQVYRQGLSDHYPVVARFLSATS